MENFKKIFFIMALGMIIFSVLAQGASSLEEGEEVLKLYLGEIEIIPVSSPTRVVIGNPGIADIVEVTKNEITLTPKAAGNTTFVVWDNFGEKSYRIKVFTDNIDEIKRRVDKLLAKLNLPEVYTQAEEEEGRVLLLGRVKIPQDRENITTILGPLKDKVVDLVMVKEEEAVVEIAVQILELDKDATNTLGFTWPGELNVIERGAPAFSTAGVKWQYFFKVGYWERGTSSAADPWTFKLDALVQEGKARILSRPRLACQSGKEAELLVGGEKPIFTSEVASAGGAGTSVEYKEYGIKLKIKPTITDEERVKLALNIDVSEVGTAETIGSSTTTTAKAYPLSKRTASTELFLDDGQTMAIGGLIKRKREEDVRKVPFAGNIPILGIFFRKTTTKTGGGTGERGDVELFITLTPKIISGKKITKPVTKPEITPSAAPGTPDTIAVYASIIQKRILENLTYPAPAKEAGFQGTVKLSLCLSERGEPLEIRLKDSSGYKILDDNALSVAKSISLYPPFPSSVGLKQLWIDVPIVYRLD